MADLSKYMSALYSEGGQIGNEDMRQTVEYQFVKAYPSVNSTNGGSIHSESNIRWLTKQFTKKPFLIPHDGNPEKDMFKMKGSAGGINGVYVDGGMANIDGYIVSIANDITDVYFDCMDDTNFGSNSSGVIWTQVVQRTIMDLSTELQNAEFKTFIGGTHDDSILEKLVEEGLEPTAENIQEEAYTRYEALMNSDTLEPQKIGEITITYRDIDNIKIVEYIDALPEDDKNKFTPIEDGTAYQATYDIQIGFPKTYYGINDMTIPFIFITDNFGFIYTFYNANDNTDNQVITTHYYPATREERIDMQNIHNDMTVAGQPNIPGTVINKMIPDNKVYDMNECYSGGTEASSSAQRGTVLPNKEDLNNILNSNFDTTTTADLFTIYGTKTGIDISTLTHIPIVRSQKSGVSTILADKYYCLPISNTTPFDETYRKVLKYFLKPTNINNIDYPVAVFNNAGMLHPYNEYIYNDDEAIQVLEGYVTFMRRVTNLLMDNSYTSWNGITFNSNYRSDPNGDNITKEDGPDFRRNWAAMINCFEVNGVDSDNNILNTIKADVFENDEQSFYEFFGVNYEEGINYSAIKFHHIYNLFIAPYINTYMQIAWTAMFKNGVVNELYCPPKALAPIREVGIGITDDEYWSGKIRLEHTYQISSTKSITQNYNFTENADLYTDGGRLRKFLCEPEKVTFIKKDLDNDIVTYRNKVSDNAFANDNNAFNMCEDYITYIKRCSSNDRTFIHQDSDNFLQNTQILLTSIPYKITKLVLNGNNVTEAKFFDDYRLYKDNEVYPSSTPSSAIVPTTIKDYIQNVQIDVNTMLPRPNKNTENNYLISHIPFWYKVGNDYEKRESTPSYILNITNIQTMDYIDGKSFGIDGFNFTGYTQDWVTFVPMVFRLYKDGQGYLLGKTPGEDVDAGIVVDYKFVKDVEDRDFWFATVWLNTRRTTVSYNIENNGADWPVNTNNGTEDYLRTRNMTIFDVDKIYTHDEQGNYISYNQYMESFISSSSFAEVVDEKVSVINDSIEEMNTTIINNKTELIQNNYEKCVIANANVNNNLTILLLENPQNNYLYQDKSELSVDTIILSNPILELEYPSSEITNTTVDTKGVNNKCRIKTIIHNGTTLEITSSILSAEDTWICNCGSVQNITQTLPDTVTVEITLNTYFDKDIETMITITFTPNNEHIIDIQPIDGNKYPSKFAMDYITLTNLNLGINDISAEDMHKYTEFGLAPILWNLGDKRTFYVDVLDVNDGSVVESIPIPAVIVGFDCDPSIKALGSVKHHIVWMTEIGNTLSEVDLIKIGMTENGVFPGFKANQGYTMHSSGVDDIEYIANKKYAFGTFMFMDGKYGHNTTQNAQLPVMKWLQNLVDVDKQINHENAYELRLVDSDIYTLLTSTNEPWWWGQRTVYEKVGDNYNEVTFTGSGTTEDPINPSYVANSFYLKNDILVNRYFDAPEEYSVFIPSYGTNPDFNSIPKYVLSAYNIYMYGENYDYKVGVSYIVENNENRTKTGVGNAWLPSLKELGVTSEMYDPDWEDTLEQTLYHVNDNTDIRNGNTTYTYTVNDTDYTYTINENQATYPLFKGRYKPFGHSNVLTRDCWVTSNTDAVDIDSLTDSTNSYDNYCTINDTTTQTVNRHLVVVGLDSTIVGTDYHTADVIERATTDNSYINTEFCFATK